VAGIAQLSWSQMGRNTASRRALAEPAWRESWRNARCGGADLTRLVRVLERTNRLSEAPRGSDPDQSETGDRQRHPDTDLFQAEASLAPTPYGAMRRRAGSFSPFMKLTTTTSYGVQESTSLFPLAKSLDLPMGRYDEASRPTLEEAHRSRYGLSSNGPRQSGRRRRLRGDRTGPPGLRSRGYCHLAGCQWRPAYEDSPILSS